MRIRPMTFSANFIVIYLSIYWFRKINNKLMNSIILSRCSHISNPVIYRIVPMTPISRTTIPLFKGFICLCLFFIVCPYLYKFVIVTFRNPVKASCCMCIPSKRASNDIRTFYKFILIKEDAFSFFRITRFIVLYIHFRIYIT